MTLLTVSEVARLLNMSAQNVVRLANLDHLPVALTLSTGERLFDPAVIEKSIVAEAKPCAPRRFDLGRG